MLMHLRVRNGIIAVFQDGFMDMEEVQKWILPTDYDHTEAEAKHLVNNMYFLNLKIRPSDHNCIFLLYL